MIIISLLINDRVSKSLINNPLPHQDVPGITLWSWRKLLRISLLVLVPCVARKTVNALVCPPVSLVTQGSHWLVSWPPVWDGRQCVTHMPPCVPGDSRQSLTYALDPDVRRKTVRHSYAPLCPWWPEIVTDSVSWLPVWHRRKSSTWQRLWKALKYSNLVFIERLGVIFNGKT